MTGKVFRRFVRKFTEKSILASILMLIVVALCACGTQSHVANSSGIEFSSLEKTGELELTYAKEFSVEEYGDYTLININQQGRFLVVPEETPVPDNIPEDVTVLKKPFSNVYLAATSAMDLIRETGSIDRIKFSSVNADGWYIQEAKDAMNDGNIVFAGKYSQPDYELLLDKGCDLVIENMMIEHSPKTKEKLISLGFPVIVERSSYEEHPIGRLEWIKLYGILFDKSDEANEFFLSELAKLDEITNSLDEDGENEEITENAGIEDDGEVSGNLENSYGRKKVAFFYVTSNGAINVRKPNDYISKMIGMAGGEYAMKNIIPEEENALSTMNIQMEEFYAECKDADIIVYNSTIDGEIKSIDDLLAKNALFADFKAVKEKKVYCTSSNFFQETTGTCDFIYDLNKALNGEDGDYRYLNKVE